MSIVKNILDATGITDSAASTIALTPPAVAVVADPTPADPIMAVIDAVFTHFEDITKRFPTLHGAIEGFHALADALLPGIAAKVSGGDLKTMVAAVLAQLLPLTTGIPILHGFLLVAQVTLGLWLGNVQATLAAKGVKV